MMSALDLAKLARHIIYAYPNLYHYFGEKDFVWSNIHQPNRNPLLFNTPGADGLKTGHIEASGYGLVGSAARDGRRIIVVLNGLASEKDRADEGARMIEAGFREFRRYQLFKPGDSIAEADVYGGSDKTVPVTVKTPVAVTLQGDPPPGMKRAVHTNSTRAHEVGYLRPLHRLHLCLSRRGQGAGAGDHPQARRPCVA